MIICLCKSVSDRKISQLIDSGFSDLKQIQNQCDVGKGCGRCVPIVESMLEKSSGLPFVKTSANFTKRKIICSGVNQCQKHLETKKSLTY